MSPFCILRRPRLAVTLLLLVLGSFPLAIAENAGKQSSGEEKGAKGKAKAESKATNTSASAAATIPAPTQGLLAFGKMLPVGEQHKELEIPSFKNGAPSSMVQAKVMIRMDDENMFLERMDIWMYGPPGEAEQDLRVQLRTATFHMPSSIIASDEPSRISRADFDLQGDTLVFDTATGQGKMVGNVRMVLHDSSSFAKSPADGLKEKEKDKEKDAGKERTSKPSDSATNSPPTAGSTPAANPRSATTTTTRVKPGTEADRASPTNPKK